MSVDEYIRVSLPADCRLDLIWLDELWHYERDDDSCFSGTTEEYLSWRLFHPAWQNAPTAECEIKHKSCSFTCSFIHCLD